MKKWFEKHKNLFLIVLSILVICLSLTILYDKFVKKNIVNNEIAMNNIL